MGAGRFASRALKTACRAVFARRRTQSSGPGLFESASVSPENKDKNKSDTHYQVSLCWWELVDSNHRSIKQQIYSLSPLATRESSHILFLLRRGTPCRSVLDYYSKAEPEMQAFFSIFLRFFQKSFLCTLHRAIFKKKERPAGVRRGAPRGISEDRRRIMYICNGIVALLVVWPGPSDCSGMAQGTVCMIAGCFPHLSFDYDT